METAGKEMDNEELRDLMKENGIGRPSTRANIIETLFKRKYIVRNKKQVLPTVTGIQLIDTIQNELLKSAELTGHWEKQLKDIEKGTFTASEFINNMKRMVEELVIEVRSETTRANISHAVVVNKESKPKEEKQSGITAETCPKCKQGALIKGKSAFGCSAYKSGCDFVLPFRFAEKKISEGQYLRMLQKGSTVILKGFKTDLGITEGQLLLDDEFKLKLQAIANSGRSLKTLKNETETPVCPKCKKGSIIKGNTAYGCSNYKFGCEFRVSFNTVREKMNGYKPTKELVYAILSKSI